MADFALKLNNISKAYQQGSQKLSILNEVSFELNKGETVALIGPSGCGKTTMLQICGLLDNADSGEVLINGKATAKFSDDEKTATRKTELGFIYQFHHLLPEFTALENVIIPQMINGNNKKMAAKRAKYLLDKMGLKNRINHRPSELSGGEQQRVAIARALANSPALLLADEPTGNLDPETAANVFAILTDMVKEISLATLIVTHNPELAKKMDRVITIQNGRLIEK